MHYVCSDIHGQYDKFTALLKKIRFSDEDQMYILGDVIDRGPRPVDMLVKALTTPNITLLLGNHELMMIDTFDTGDGNVWLSPSNGGKATYEQLKRMLPSVMQSIVELVRDCPLMLPSVKVGERRFCLVHSCPPNTLCELTPRLNNNVCSRIDIERMVWDRGVCQHGIDPEDFLPEDTAEAYKDHIFIVGHTPTALADFGKASDRHFNRIISTGRIYNIDCGCAFGAKLGCLRLEDLKTFYVH